MRTIDVSQFAVSVQATIEEVETDGHPLLVTSGARAVVCMLPVDSDDFVLANAPEVVRSMESADRDLAAGETVQLSTSGRAGQRSRR